MSIHVGDLPFVESPNRTATSGRSIRVIVIHDMEYPERTDAAEAVGAFFSHTSTQASAHVCADSNSAVRCVKDGDVAWAAPGANSDGLQIELAGYGSQTHEQWLDAYSKGELHLVARLVAQWCKKYDIPPKRLSRADLAAGKRGICGHRDVSAVYHLSDHSDPGDNFPWDHFIGLVQDVYKQITDAPDPIQKPLPTNKISVKDVETALHFAKPDRTWDHKTDYALKVLRQGPKGRFPVRDLQRICDTTVDGDWGAVSQRHYIATVTAVQKALGVKADGVWGPSTNDAFHRARNKFFLK